MFSLGFTQKKADYSFFIYKTQNSFVLALIYVDDIFLIGTYQVFIAHVEDVLDATFNIKELGLIKYYLGLEVSRSSNGIYIHQHSLFMIYW